MRLKNILLRDSKDNLGEEGIVVPALLWWAGVPLSLLVLLYLFGVL